MQRLGWHILKSDRRLGFADRRFVRVGVRLKYRPRHRHLWEEPSVPHIRGAVLCEQGMHASPGLLNAYECWREKAYELICGADWVCRVLVEGVSAEQTVLNKFVGTHRTVLGMCRYDEILDRVLDEAGVLEVMRKRNRRNGTKVEVR